jgi:3-isopropylmalate dehydrogenase
MAAIMAAQMMLTHLEEKDAAELVEKAVIKVIQHDMKTMDAGKMGVGTSEVGDLVVKYIRNGE